MKNIITQFCNKASGIRRFMQIRHERRLREAKLRIQQQLDAVPYTKMDADCELYDGWLSLERDVIAEIPRARCPREEKLFRDVAKASRSMINATNQSIICWGKYFIDKMPNGYLAIDDLTDTDVLLFALCYHRFDSQKIAGIMNLPRDGSTVALLKYDLRNKLIFGEVSKPLANAIVYWEDFVEE